jgi:hypothetical protein
VLYEAVAREASERAVVDWVETRVTSARAAAMEVARVASARAEATVAVVKAAAARDLWRGRGRRAK